MSEVESSARLLYRAALVIFLVTIVIGILNGMDLWEPSHNMLLTHVHSGTLGWITLCVFAAALRVFGDQNTTGTRNLSIFAVAATALYVIAFATTTGVLRPIAGTLELIAIVWMLVWVARQYSGSTRSVSQLGLYLAMISLTIGGILGVLLGLFVANGEIPGLSNDVASSLAGAHPPAMLIGYLVLAGAAVVHWLLDGPQTAAGRIVMWALFVGGILANLAFILDVDALVQAATGLEVIAIITFTVHMWGRIKPSAWSGQGSDNFARAAAVFLLVGVGLLVYVVQLFMSGELDPETGTGPVRVLLAFDHAMFIGVMTNALFALVARSATRQVPGALVWVVNLGVVLFLVGLVADVDILIRIGAPVMGLALIYGVFVFLARMGGTPRPKHCVTEARVEDIEDGAGRRLYLVRPEKPSGAAVLYLHWYDEAPNANRSQYVDEARRMAGYGVTSALPQLVFPWEGAPSDLDSDLTRIGEEARFLDDVYQRLVDEPGVDPSRVGLVGHDFGAMHGTSLFGERDLSCAVLVAATPRWSDWFLTFWPITTDRFDYMRGLHDVDPITRLARARCPVLFQFAKADFYIAPMTGSEMFSATPEPRAVLSYDADHGMDLPDIVDDRHDFLVEHLGLEAIG